MEMNKLTLSTALFIFWDSTCYDLWFIVTIIIGYKLITYKIIPYAFNAFCVEMMLSVILFSGEIYTSI